MSILYEHMHSVHSVYGSIMKKCVHRSQLALQIGSR